MSNSVPGVSAWAFSTTSRVSGEAKARASMPLAVEGVDGRDEPGHDDDAN